MRYTTIVDISEFPALYRSESTRLLYLHMCLRSGYHDYDRDVCRLSIRQLARDVGLTIAAVRHALAQLAKYEMIIRRPEGYLVRKFLVEQPISKRARNKKEQHQQQHVDERERAHAQLQETRAKQQQQVDELRKQGKTSFMVYYEQQSAKGLAGDLEAAAWCAENAKTYQMHAAQIAKEQSKQ